jgi:hypothetical protein
MGSIVGPVPANITASAQLGAFQNQIWPLGLDLGRCVFHQSLGVWEADPNTSFLQGMLVSRNTTTGLIDVCTGYDAFGIAKWNKISAYYAVQIDEPHTFTGVAGAQTITLNYGNATNTRVALAAGATASSQLCTYATDWTSSGGSAAANNTSGNITQVNGSAKITNGVTVYVTYTFALTAQQALNTQGVNFWNQIDDVSIQDGRITIITDWSIIFTTMYDTSQFYTLTGANSNLYAGGISVTTGGPTALGNAGLFTNSTTDGGNFVGRVMQLPSPGDPFLGITFAGGPFAYASSAGGLGQITG